MNVSNARAALLEFALSYAAMAAHATNQISTDLLLVVAVGLVIAARLLDLRIREHHQLGHGLAVVAFVARGVVGLFATTTDLTLLPLLVRCGLWATIVYGATRCFLSVHVHVSRLTEKAFDGNDRGSVLSPRASSYDPVVSPPSGAALTSAVVDEQPNRIRRTVEFSREASEPLRTVYDESRPFALDDLLPSRRHLDEPAAS